jgi:hypothetical protein
MLKQFFRRWTSGKRRWLLPASVALLLIGFGAQAFFARSEQRAFDQAMQRWDNRDFQRYRVELIHTYVTGDFFRSLVECRQVLDVEGRRVRTIISSSCQQPYKLSVDEIFRRFEQHVHQPLMLRRCGYGGCICSTSHISAEFDPHLGFPRQLSRKYEDVTPLWREAWSHVAADMPAVLRQTAARLGEIAEQCGPDRPWPPESQVYEEDIRILKLEPLP